MTMVTSAPMWWRCPTSSATASALRADEAGLDPGFGSHVQRWVDARGREPLDVFQHDHLLARVIARPADRGVLDRLVSIAERHADAAGGRVPLGVAQRRGQLLGRRLLAAVGG